MSNNSLSQLFSTLSQSLQLNTPATPTATSLLIELLQLMTGTSGVITDINPGSNIRTLASIIGMIAEQQNIANRTSVAQSILSGLFALYNIPVPVATVASGNVTFTLTSALTTPFTIGAGTVVGTSGGATFTTTSPATIPAESLSISAPIESTQTGTLYNVAAGSITQLLSTLPVSMTVNNAAPTSGGTNNPSPSTLIAILNNTILSYETGTPAGIAAAAYGVSLSDGETALYTTVYEPWVAQLTAGVTITASPGYTVYIDNGSGSASTNLLQAVLNKLNGTPQYVPAGVPFSVLAVTPVDVDVVVDAVTTTAYANSIPYISTLITNSVNRYFDSLQFGDTVDGNAMEVNIVNATSGLLQSASVTLTPPTPVSVPAYQRGLLNILTLNVTAPA